MKLIELQRRMAADIMRPLTNSERMAPETRASYIKPSSRLTARERLEIYNRQYWFRILDSFADDFPGLRAVLGERVFNRLIRAYLADCPSRSFTMRNLGARLERWLQRNPEYAGKRLELALDMVKLEWAHIEAFDGAAVKPLGPEDLLELRPDFRIGLQPYIRLLPLRYAVDDLRVQVSRSEEHGTASNAVGKNRRRAPLSFAQAQRERIYLAVHLLDFTVYYRRLTREEFSLLSTLRKGAAIGEAIESALVGTRLGADDLRARIELWFAAWAELGWLTPASSK